jgi:sulfofructose kinase
MLGHVETVGHPHASAAHPRHIGPVPVAPLRPTPEPGLMATRSPNPTIVCVGHAALDRVFVVDHWPADSAKIVAHRYFESGGGMAANAAVAIARLGATALFWGPVGADATADIIEEQLRQEGVNVAGLRRFREATSSTSAVLLDARGERLVVGYRGTALQSPAAWLRLESIPLVEAVLADVRWPQGAIAALRAARVARIPAILDGDVADHEVLVELAASADHVLYSERGARVLGGDDFDRTLRTTVEAGARVAAVTLGERGLAWVEDSAPETVRRMAAFPVRAVDTLAAGDVFHGAYAVCLTKGYGIEQALCLASAAAALKCTRPGGREGAPDWQEVMGFLSASSGGDPAAEPLAPSP